MSSNENKDKANRHKELKFQEALQQLIRSHIYGSKGFEALVSPAAEVQPLVVPACFRSLLSCVTARNISGCVAIINSMSAEEINTPFDTMSTTLLMKAVEVDENIDIVKALVRSGADISVKNRFNATPVSIACKNNNRIVLLYLLPLYTIRDHPFCLFDILSSESSEDTILFAMEILIKNDSQWIDQVTPSQCTCLHISARLGLSKITKYLLSLGADRFLKAMDDVGYTPLQLLEETMHKLDTSPMIKYV